MRTPLEVHRARVSNVFAWDRLRGPLEVQCSWSGLFSSVAALAGAGGLSSARRTMAAFAGSFFFSSIPFYFMERSFVATPPRGLAFAKPERGGAMIHEHVHGP